MRVPTSQRVVLMTGSYCGVYGVLQRSLGTAEPSSQPRQLIDPVFQSHEGIRADVAAGRRSCHADSSELSKWIYETKAPSLIRIMSAPLLHVPFLEAQAERLADQVQVEKLIRITRKTA